MGMRAKKMARAMRLMVKMERRLMRVMTKTTCRN